MELEQRQETIVASITSMEVRDDGTTLSAQSAMGRYGMFKYNNSDHSILTALLSVENIDGAGHDVWAVNSDEQYLEEIEAS